MKKPRDIVILGSTGSIGKQALQIVDLHPERFRVVALTAHRNGKLLAEQVKKYRPLMAGLSGGSFTPPSEAAFCEWHFGDNALDVASSQVPCDDVLVSVVGMIGLGSVLNARKSGKRVLLANKEALVAGGQLVMDVCRLDDENPSLIPVDSEHSAIFQCLLGAKGNLYDRLILTASGGPFRTWSKEQMDYAGLEEALSHPTWKMGEKITIDSASMFNKALEIIEAKWLFDAKPNQIDVLVHPKSIIHSMVVFQDGAVMAQMGMPDMRVPIAFAMAYPERINTKTPPMNLYEMAGLHFERPDLNQFPALRLAYEALEAGGAACCVLNAANETAVNGYLHHAIRFGQIAEVVEETLMRIGTLPADSLEAVLEADRQARAVSADLINELSREGI
ncbi:MAG: 1-deoxy-D-xylulose-5-phosphate reductoisomerase [Christensenellales bacterium]|jgi:1-deoxy-D-xylulose-5-phosphate reductoisomerase